MPTLRVSDVNGWTSLNEDAIPIASYLPQCRRVRVSVAGSGGRSVILEMEPSDAAAFCNELMSAIHEFKLATKPRQPAKKLLRKQATKSTPRY
jgi:hypothetical protein